MTWFGHRRLAIANSYSKFLTVVLIPPNYDTEYNMDNVKIAAMCRKASMGKAENLMNKTVCLRYLLSHLATLIQLQKANELPEERSLLHSPFMMSLVSLCDIFQLEQVFQSSEVFHIDPKSAQVVADIPGNV